MSNNSKCILCGRTESSDTTLNLNEAFITAYMMKKLETPFNQTEAFKLGIIDENGSLLRRPETLEEKLSYTAIDAYLTKIRKLLGNKADILNHNIYLEKATDASKLPIELYEKELEFKNELQVISMRFKECLKEAKKNRLPTELIEKIILESFS